MREAKVFVRGKLLTHLDKSPDVMEEDVKERGVFIAGLIKRNNLSTILFS